MGGGPVLSEEGKTFHRHPALTFYASQVLAKKMAVQGVIVRLQESGSALEQKSIDAEVRNIKY